MLIFVTSNSFSYVAFEFNLGFGLDFPLNIVSNFYNTPLYLGEKLGNSISDSDRKEIIRNFADMVNLSKAGLNYGIHAQMGGRFDDFISLGLEFGIDFNMINTINGKGRLSDSLSLISAFEPRLYTRLDFFVGAILLFTGPRINVVAVDKDCILTEFGVFGWDLGVRSTFSFLMLEGYYNWNIQDNRFSGFKFGIGFEFGII
ncbi:hypothetical protein [Borrelia sp. HM]|uniref:hypothetical protein n=1 Tax=Borrelia sp. HM TaxID=1882662 RepID=UPI002105B760|nr:hypothetical protein [Borrelia sp. HM]